MESTAQTSSDLPVIIGAGITGMAISARLSQRKIRHIMVGTPPPNVAPKLGESMEMLSSILLDEMFPDLREYFVPKRGIFFYSHNAVLGANFNIARKFFPTADIVSIGGVTAFILGLVGFRRPRLGAIHLDRLGFDGALERKVRNSEYCEIVESRVAHVDCESGSDRVQRLRLENGREIHPSFVFDASNQARVVPKALDLESTPLSDGCQRVTFAHYRATPESRAPDARAEHWNWIESSNLVRLFDPVDGVHGAAWCIPIDDYVSMGISRPADSELSDDDALELLERSMARRGLRYRDAYPRAVGARTIEARFFVYDRICGSNWVLAGQTGCQGWFSTLTGVESSLFCASIADRFVESPQKAAQCYEEYIDAVVRTHQGFNAFHASTVDTPLPVVERAYAYTLVANLYGRVTYQAQICNGTIAAMCAPFERFFLRPWIWLGKILARNRFCPLVVSEPESFSRHVVHARERTQPDAPIHELPVRVGPSSPLISRIESAIEKGRELLDSIPVAEGFHVSVDGRAIGDLGTWKNLIRRAAPRVAGTRLVPESVVDQGEGLFRVYARFHARVDGKDRSSRMVVLDCTATEDGLKKLSMEREHLIFLLGNNARYGMLFALMRVWFAIAPRPRTPALKASEASGS